MQRFISAIFFHKSCHFRMGCANAVPTTVYNHHNGFCTILRNTKSCSGLSACCHNICCRRFLTIQKQQTATAKGCVNLVKVDGRAYLQCDRVTYFEYRSSVCIVIAAHNDEVAIFRHIDRFPFLGNICNGVVLYHKFHQIVKTLVQIRGACSRLSVKVNGEYHAGNFVDRRQINGLCGIGEFHCCFEVSENGIAVFILHISTILVFVFIDTGSSGNQFPIPHNRAETCGIAACHTKEVTVYTGNGAVVCEHFLYSFFQTVFCFAFHFFQFQCTFCQVDGQYIDVLNAVCCHPAVLFICHPSGDGFLCFVFIDCLSSKYRCHPSSGKCQRCRHKSCQQPFDAVESFFHFPTHSLSHNTDGWTPAFHLCSIYWKKKQKVTVQTAYT
ncbi:unknown [Clostridium sp. CAG:505]|nr:unknown [Clostridium sp. CAG:505]